MSKLWGGRFDNKKMDPDVMEFTSSLSVDKELAKYDCISTKVHVEMLAKCGFLSKQEKTSLVGALDKLAKKIDKGTFNPEGHEDIHSAIQNFVEKQTPQAAKKMHTARSRNEQVVNDVRLYCKEKVSDMTQLIIVLQKGLVKLAKKNMGCFVPGYTHLNRAQPIAFSHLVLSYVEMLERDLSRLKGAGERLDISCMGSGAIAGSSLKLDRKFTASKLGFSKLSANSIDAVSDRDFMIDFTSCLALVSMHLSRMAEDLILYSTQEFGFIEIGQEYCTGSSLMPQKKNPDVLELVRGKTASVIGAVNTLFVLLKAQPHSYNRDLQEDKAPLFEAIKTVSGQLLMMTGAANSIKVNKKACLDALEDEFIYATDIAEYLVRKGVAFKDAHDIVGEIIKTCVKKKINISDLSISELKKFSGELDGDILELLSPETSCGNKKTPGSTNPRLIEKEIARWSRKLK